MSGRGLSEYIAEATEILEALGRDLLLLDERRGQELDPDLLNAIFRAAHSLKGLSAMFGQDAVAGLAHAAEDLLDRLRLGRAELDDWTLDSLLEALDVLNALLAGLARGEAGEALQARAGEVADRLQAGERPVGGAAEDVLDRVGLEPHVRNVLTEYEEHRLRENLRRGAPLYRVRVQLDLADFDQRLAEMNLRIKRVGELLSTLPSSEPGERERIAFDLLVGLRDRSADLAGLLADVPAEVVRIPVREPVAPARGKRGARGPSGGVVSPGSPPAPPKERRRRPRAVAPAPPEGSAPSPTPAEASRMETELSLRSLTRTVRVDIGRLDALMNHVGELLLTRATLLRLAEEARQGGSPAGALWAQELTRESRHLERRLGSLQKGLLEARMVPLGQVFEKLSRLVRRAAREAGKELELVVAGGEVELDKLIVEELSDPLMHIIRNAIDHGIEPPAAREAAGKSRVGRVTLRAAPQGNHVVIEVEDDGAGMDERRIRDVAITRGLLSRERATELTRRELFNLIFQPGFSTAREVSALSGRGVGLDVVKTNIAHLSGIIDVWSERGRGTRFTLTLPVTLAILRALVVGASGRTYAMPLNSVLEILSVTPDQLRTVERQEVVTVRGQTVPFVRLARLLGLPERPVARHFAVVVGLAQERLALAVDVLEGQRDIVTKPLPPRLRDVRGIAGATDLGDRQTVLVLDVAALMEEVLRPPAGGAAGLA